QTGHRTHPPPPVILRHLTLACAARAPGVPGTSLISRIQTLNIRPIPLPPPKQRGDEVRRR
ncbi:hypothetical protein KJ865_01255, partial [Myxococcota bacterium]|nr:hypothetical protein [Myxococcota bacterium]